MRIILTEEALQVVALCNVTDRPAEYLNAELNGLADAAYGPKTA